MCASYFCKWVYKFIQLFFVGYGRSCDCFLVKINDLIRLRSHRFNLACASIAVTNDIKLFTLSLSRLSFCWYFYRCDLGKRKATWRLVTSTEKKFNYLKSKSNHESIWISGHKQQRKARQNIIPFAKSAHTQNQKERKKKRENQTKVK